jgi:hypothetical protein
MRPLLIFYKIFGRTSEINPLTPKSRHWDVSTPVNLIVDGLYLYLYPSLDALVDIIHLRALHLSAMLEDASILRHFCLRFYYFLGGTGSPPSQQPSWFGLVTPARIHRRYNAMQLCTLLGDRLTDDSYSAALHKYLPAPFSVAKATIPSPG